MRKRKLVNMFKSTASLSEQALVLIFDLENFSKFFSQPDVQQYVPKFINHIFKCMDVIINGGIAYWMKKDNIFSPFFKPVHIKYLGDGALYIWTFKEIDEEKIIYLLNRLWNLKNKFEKVLSKCLEDVPVVDLPTRIRFGLTAGSVYKLTYANSTKSEYIGYCINLASRLQSYCRDLGFIASARISLPQKELNKYNYIKVIAKKLKGFPQEIVIVDKNEFNDLDTKLKNELFQELE